MALPPKYIDVLLPFLHPRLTEDDFQQMVLLCCETQARTKRAFTCAATEAIKNHRAQQRRENNALYNPYRNISLDQCIGGSKSPVGSWLNLSDWQEWD